MSGHSDYNYRCYYSWYDSFFLLLITTVSIDIAMTITGTSTSTSTIAGTKYDYYCKEDSVTMIIIAMLISILTATSTTIIIITGEQLQ